MNNYREQRWKEIVSSPLANKTYIEGADQVTNFTFDKLF
jgi:hypothetical protein